MEEDGYGSEEEFRDRILEELLDKAWKHKKKEKVQEAKKKKQK